MSFSENIKKVRTEMLMSQQEFAEALGVAFSTVNRWENGRGKKPTFKTMKAIDAFCKEHGLSYDIKTIFDDK